MQARIAAVLLVSLAPIGAAAAQTPGFSVTQGIDTPRAEIAAGVSMNGFTDVNTRPTCEALTLPCGSGKEFGDFGWSLSGARSVSDWLALTGEIAGASNTWYSKPFARTADINHVYSFMLGPRVSTPFLHSSSGRPIDSRVFGQVLFGAQVSEVAEGGNAIRPGGGIDVHTRGGVIVRMELDYSFVQQPQSDRRSISGARFLMGVVLGVE